MISTVEIDKPRITGRRSAIWLKLDSRDRVSDLRRPENVPCPGIERIMPLSLPEIKDAVASARGGCQASARYSVDTGSRTCFLELHCFPGGINSGDEISCFLVDRTEEEEDSRRLQEKIYVLDIINQAVRAFAETRNLSEILRIILLGVTAGPGLGFNRGFILLANESRTCLWGCLATGPSTAEEAGAIWRELESRSLTFGEILGLYKSSKQNTDDIHVNRLAASLKISLAEKSNFIVRAAMDGHSLITGPETMNSLGDLDIVEKFGTDCMAVIPLISREGLQGVLLADNLITKRPITASDLGVLEIFARYASDAIENSRLYGRLEQQICRLKEANEKIIESRENLIKAEKLSSVAKIALEVAHEIRNPLTVIGGYANSSLRKLTPEDQSRKVFDIICRQATRIENALDRFSSVVALSENKEGYFRLADLVRDTLGMLATRANPDPPRMLMEEGVEKAQVFVDKGLFLEAMMVILRRAAQITAGMNDIVVNISMSGKSGVIFISAGDDRPKFAEEFYRTLKDGRGEPRNQDMAVALEILQHYGGGIGIISQDKSPVRLYVEFPLCKEG